MSVTVTAVPILFIYSMIVASSGAGAYVASKVVDWNNQYNYDYNKNNGMVHIDDNTLKQLQEKEFETIFVDRDTLIKTITEHGGRIINELNDTIKCSIEDFTLDFYKESEEKTAPYKVKIKYNSPLEAVSDLMKDLNSEYTYNTQEASYNKVIENLEQKNMEYEEEVYDDDTIVITVNLD